MGACFEPKSERRGLRLLSGSSRTSACESLNTASHTRPLLLAGTESLKCSQGANSPELEAPSDITRVEMA